MTLSTSRFAYQDCYNILDLALERTLGARIPQPSPEACTFLRMRLHQARKLDREENARTFEKGHPMHGRSQYDKLVVRVREDEGRNYVYVEWGGVDVGDVEPLGEPLALEAPKPQLQIAHHPIEAEALLDAPPGTFIKRRL